MSDNQTPPAGDQKPKNLGGRPTKFKPELCQRIIDNIKICMPLELACKAAGVSYAAFRIWMRKGEEAKSGRFREFFEDVQRAESEAMSANLATIVLAVKNRDWRAAAWILERRHAEFFSKSRIELTGQTAATSFEALMHEIQEIEERRAQDLDDAGAGDAPAPAAPAAAGDDEEAEPLDDDEETGR